MYNRQAGLFAQHRPREGRLLANYRGVTCRHRPKSLCADFTRICLELPEMLAGIRYTRGDRITPEAIDRKGAGNGREARKRRRGRS